MFFRCLVDPLARLYASFTFRPMTSQCGRVGVVMVSLVNLAVEDDMNGFYPG